MTTKYLTFTAAALLLATTVFTVPALAQDAANEVTFDNALAAFNYGDNNLASRYFWQLAGEGDPRAQYYLAYMLDSGLGNGRDPSTAFSWYNKSANQDYLPSIVQMGYLYSVGRGVTKSEKDSFKWYARGAQMGDAVAQNNLATMIRSGRPYRKDDKLAAQWFKLAAEQGNPRAQFNLASMHRLGDGVEKNEAEAVRLYSAAAKQGDALAQNALGYMHENGIGTAKDMATAVIWYRRAAEQNNLQAQLSLARIYEERAINKQNPTRDADAAQAAIWYTHAANAGDQKAQTRLGHLYAIGFGLPKNDTEAYRWFKTAGENKNYPPAMVSMAQIIENGKGVRADKTKAANLYEQAAMRGYGPAMLELGRMYSQGTGVAKNNATAYQWYTIAANVLEDPEQKADAVVARINLSKQLTQTEIQVATAAIKSWKPKKADSDDNASGADTLSYQ